MEVVESIYYAVAFASFEPMSDITDLAFSLASISLFLYIVAYNNSRCCFELTVLISILMQKSNLSVCSETVALH